jgi:hypothetical protein
MVAERHVYGEVEHKTDLREIFQAIRRDVEQADSREALTELYRRAGYLVTLTHAPSWKEEFGDEIDEIRRLAEEEFAATARKINQRAKAIGTEADYDETWGGNRVGAADVAPTTTTVAKVVKVPEAARNVQFHDRGLPERYRSALQEVR